MPKNPLKKRKPNGITVLRRTGGVRAIGKCDKSGMYLFDPTSGMLYDEHGVAFRASNRTQGWDAEQWKWFKERQRQLAREGRAAKRKKAKH
jgi:hypothetical protein